MRKRRRSGGIETEVKRRKYTRDGGKKTDVKRKRGRERERCEETEQKRQRGRNRGEEAERTKHKKKDRWGKQAGQTEGIRCILRFEDKFNVLH